MMSSFICSFFGKLTGDIFFSVGVCLSLEVLRKPPTRRADSVHPLLQTWHRKVLKALDFEAVIFFQEGTSYVKNDVFLFL